MPSTVIANIEYEAELARLTVNFTTGRIYHYFMVPPDVAMSFQSALTKGTFFNTKIRDKYLFREVTPSDA